jgi:hypothetical protein
VEDTKTSLDLDGVAFFFYILHPHKTPVVLDGLVVAVYP